MAPHWFGGYVSSFSPQGVFGFSFFVSGGVTSLPCRLFDVHARHCSEVNGNQNKSNGLYLSHA